MTGGVPTKSKHQQALSTGTNEERDALFKASLDDTLLDIDHSYKPQNLSVRAGFGTQLGKVRVEFGETRDKLVTGGYTFEGGRNEGCGLYRCEGLKNRERGWNVGVGGDCTREDGEFTCDVEAVEVIGWMRFLCALSTQSRVISKG